MLLTQCSLTTIGCVKDQLFILTKACNRIICTSFHMNFRQETQDQHLIPAQHKNSTFCFIELSAPACQRMKSRKKWLFSQRRFSKAAFLTFKFWQNAVDILTCMSNSEPFCVKLNIFSERIVSIFDFFGPLKYGNKILVQILGKFWINSGQILDKFWTNSL